MVGVGRIACGWPRAVSLCTPLLFFLRFNSTVLLVELPVQSHFSRSSMEQPAIHVRNLRKCFRKRNGFRKTSELWAIDDVSFSVAKGETYGLLGPNGSGKSSLIRVLSTLLIADSGRVKMLGYSLPEDQEQVRRIIGR